MRESYQRPDTHATGVQKSTPQHQSRPLEKIARRKTRTKRFGAFDIETDGLGGKEVFVSWVTEEVEYKKTKKKGGGIVAVPTGKVGKPESSLKLSDFLDEAIKNDKYAGIIWYAHNGGFDMARAYDYFIDLIIDDYRIDVIESGLNNIAGLKIYDKDEKLVFTFRDSMRVYGGSLAEFTDQFCGEENRKLTGAIDFESGEKFDPYNTKHVEYALRDVTSLLEAVINMELLMIEHFDTDLKITAAACAMASFRTTLKFNDAFWRLPKTIEDFSRRAYVGGYVYLGCDCLDLHNDCVHVDVGSSYPASMLEFGVPYGGPYFTMGFNVGDVGVYRIRIVDADGLTVVGYKSGKGLLWPRGSFETYVTSLDIQNLIENGNDFEVLEGYKFDGVIYPFEDFIGGCRDIRKAHKGTELEMMAKLFQNSLYGKFGTKPEITHLSYYRDAEQQLSFGYGGFDDDDNLLEQYAVRELEEIDAPYLMPHWAAWITSAARLRLHRAIRIAGYENFLYSDTDSIIMKRAGFENIKSNAPHILGNEYGQFGIDKEWQEFRVHGPKVYAGFGGKPGKKPEYTGRAKGVPKKQRTEEVFKKLLYKQNIDTFHFESVASLSSVMKGNPLSVERKRNISKIENSAGWVIEDGKIKPVRLDL